MNYRIRGHGHFPIEAATFEGRLYSADRLNPRAVWARLKYIHDQDICLCARKDSNLRPDG